MKDAYQLPVRSADAKRSGSIGRLIEPAAGIVIDPTARGRSKRGNGIMIGFHAHFIG